MRVVHRGQQACLGRKTGAHLWVRAESTRQLLDRHRTVEVTVPRCEDDAESPAPQLVADLIGRKCGDHLLPFESHCAVPSRARADG